MPAPVTLYFIFRRSDNGLEAIESSSRKLAADDPTFYEVTSTETYDPKVPKLAYEGDPDQLSFVIHSYEVINIDTDWRVNFTDYKQARAQMFVVMVARIQEVGSFYNLSMIERRIASAWFIVGDAERDSVHSFDEQMINANTYNAHSVESRDARLTAAMMQVYNRLSHDQVNAVVTSMDFGRTSYNYVRRGCEGTVEGNDEGLFDYILGRENTSWALNGLCHQNYTPKGMANCQELADKLIDILKNGNY